MSDCWCVYCGLGGFWATAFVRVLLLFSLLL